MAQLDLSWGFLCCNLLQQSSQVLWDVVHWSSHCWWHSLILVALKELLNLSGWRTMYLLLILCRMSCFVIFIDRRFLLWLLVHLSSGSSNHLDGEGLECSCYLLWFPLTDHQLEPLLSLHFHQLSLLQIDLLLCLRTNLIQIDHFHWTLFYDFSLVFHPRSQTLFFLLW